ncbi:PAS domain-containing SpoIIE family protein phosphatase/ATP-binding protein [Streptomyces cocklensis]|uniref:protein-serine/threonine phosphatase n=1 Tax=Actinacidiphila cocklensis TaxID=887465 RepID=A0A9W4GRT0_9ACTN|nr:SpoIIE family protein phosphatase [Actinacidiphila cocklensis]MDD1062802.1 PAS domain-containing SpoIIE family protein phosphatase/ATP-binding protein [Actinacidiphila cocklensis]CAG6394053.1 PAS domain S-box-containing protein [Actinacidiphila cocklensis]
MSDSGDTPPAAQPPADHHPPPDEPREQDEAHEPHGQNAAGLPDDTGVGGTAAGTLMDTLRVAVVMLDTSGRVLLWSPLAEEVLGWAGEHIVGRRVGGLFAPGEQRSAGQRPVPSPAHAEQLLGELLRSGRWDGILSLLHRDGHTVQVEARASLLVDGDGRPFVLASMVETSRLRTLEHDLAALDSLFDASPLGVAIFDKELRYVRVNEALARMNGRSVADHVGHTVAEVLDVRDAESLTALQQDVLVTGRPVIDLVSPAPGGHGHRSLSYHRLADRAGRVLGISATVIDVTERVEAASRAERARRRLALLNDVGSRIAGQLDVRRNAEELAASLVPTFGDYSGVVLHSQLAEGGELPTAPYSDSTPMRQTGVGAITWSPDVVRMIRPGQAMSFDRKSPFGEVLATGRPKLLGSREELVNMTSADDPKTGAALAVGVQSMLVLPLRAHGVVLGLLVVSRAGGREAFDQEDVALGMELADRAGASLDNARLYVREREGALMLQRSLLPRSTPAAPGVDVAYRYVPGSSVAEVGGDWFDVLPLAGGRVGFVVGDVMGHGLPAAATMGRLRTAVRTLAGLDMAPDELLRRVSELGDDLAQNQAEGWMATAVYAVYDPSTRRCTIAQAGHPPPVLVEPGDRPGRQAARLLDLPPGVPLGVGGVRFETTELDVPDGTVLVLYTDGLVESRRHDIGTGLERLRTTLCRPLDSLEEACDDLLAAMEPGREPDDVALLMARLGTLPSGSTASWTFPAEASAVRLARRRVRDALADWGLPELTDVTVLLVSELVTNSLRYAHGPIGVRMVCGTSLLVEVSDPLPDPPRERVATAEDEGGRGLQLVAGASRRWGTRHGPLGKTVWFELALP